MAMPAAPVVLTLQNTSRLGLCHQYVALAAGALDAAAMCHDVLVLQWLVARLFDPGARPPWLRQLPRGRAIKRATRPLARRLGRAVRVATGLVDHDGDLVRAVRARVAKFSMIATSNPRNADLTVRPRAVYEREFRPYLRTAHLILPLIARRWPGFAERPELAPPDIPIEWLEVLNDDQLDGLLGSDRWIYLAIEGAERWRLLLTERNPYLDLIKIEAVWVD